jgi:hypothetical protein
MSACQLHVYETPVGAGIIGVSSSTTMLIATTAIPPATSQAILAGATESFLP